MLAATSSNSSGGSGVGFIVVALIAIGFAVLIRRAGAKRVGQAAQTRSAAVIGSEVMTGSGLYGTVVGQDDEQVLLEIAPGVQVRFAKAAIAKVLSGDDFGEIDDHPAAPDDEAAESPTELPAERSADPPDDVIDPPGDTTR